jgi:hypothetical protein
MPTAITAPNLLVDPGFLFWAPTRYYRPDQHCRRLQVHRHVACRLAPTRRHR